MANYFNLIAGFITFIGSSAMAYMLWTPVTDFIALMPIELFIVSATLWTAILFVSIVYLPFIMIVSDDKG